MSEVGGIPTPSVLGARSFRAMIEAAADGLVLVDSAGTVRFANASAAHLFGADPEALVGRSVEDVIPTEFRQRHRTHRAAFARSPRTRPMGMGMELWGQRMDGERVPLEISLGPVELDGEAYVVACLRDMSTVQRLRDLSQATLDAAERERERIAQELHDDTLQRLSALLLRLRLLRGSASEEMARQLAEVSEDLAVAAEGLRTIARGLRPPELVDLGLEAAVRAALRGFDEAASCTFTLDFDPTAETLSPPRALAVYRIVQESVSNAVRHADADHVRVHIERDEGGTTVTVEDDGRGFDVHEALAAGRGLGLQGILERGSAVGGRVELDGRPGEGATVRVSIPAQESTRRAGGTP